VGLEDGAGSPVEAAPSHSEAGVLVLAPVSDVVRGAPENKQTNVTLAARSFLEASILRARGAAEEVSGTPSPLFARVGTARQEP